jgi:protein O-GlcNAc transferase
MKNSSLIQNLEEALALHKALKHDEAERIYAKVRTAAPKNFDAWYLSGAMAFQRGGHLEKAVDLLQKAQKLKPDSMECRLFLGMALADTGRFAEAEPHLSRALKKMPQHAEAWENLARCQKAIGHIKDAIASLEKFVLMRPANAAGYEQLGEVTAIAFGFPAAEAHFRKAAEMDSTMAVAWSNLGLSLIEQSGRIAEGMECFDRALQADPFLTSASSARALGLMRLYKAEESLDLHNSILWMEPQNARVLSARNMLLNYLPNQNCHAVFESHKEFGNYFPTDEFQVFFNSTDPDKKLRVGFVSPDLRHHSVAYFLRPILANLASERVETILYHCHHTEDSTSADLRALAKKWTNLNGLNDAVALEMIRKDAPDILIDLAGHSSLNRLPLFAKNPAPVLMTYLGYPNTTGLPAIGYRLVDGVTDPEGKSDPFATEKLIRFSSCAWTYEPPADSPEPSMPDIAAPITFGSFNNFLKVTGDTLILWSRILEAVPNSRLLIKSPYLDDPDVSRCVRERLHGAGIPLDRAEILGFFPSSEEHLSTYSRVDVALDTYPYNGTTTTCEALWMGVPVVSLVGDRHSSRVGLSLLSAAGHAEWAVEKTEDYIDKAIALASDRPHRAQLRSGLRHDLMHSIICDHIGQASRFEAALRQTWQSWCCSQK